MWRLPWHWMVCVHTQCACKLSLLNSTAEVVGRQFLFSDGTDLRQIMLKKDGKCVLRKLTLLCSPIIVAEEKLLQLSQKSVLSMKRGSVESFSTVCEWEQVDDCT